MKPACRLDRTALEMAALPLRRCWPALTPDNLAKALLAFDEAPSTTPAANPAELLTLSEVAAMYSVSKGTVWGWINSSRLPRVRVGERLIRFRRADAEALATVTDQKLQTPNSPRNIESTNETKAGHACRQANS